MKRSPDSDGHCGGALSAPDHLSPVSAGADSLPSFERTHGCGRAPELILTGVVPAAGMDFD